MSTPYPYHVRIFTRSTFPPRKPTEPWKEAEKSAAVYVKE